MLGFCPNRLTRCPFSRGRWKWKILQGRARQRKSQTTRNWDIYQTVNRTKTDFPMVFLWQARDPTRLSQVTNIHTHQCYALRNLLKLSWDNSGQKRYNRDTNRHPATSHTPKKAVWGCLAVQVDIKWWLLLSFGAWWCLLVSHVVWRSGEGVWGVSQRVSECCLWTRVRFGASEGVSECSGHVLYSKCSLLEKLWKSKFHSLDTFETSKYQNRPTKAP